MTLSRLRKTYYSLLFIFLTLLVASYSNLAQGGAVLWTGPNLFYITVFLVFASLFYLIASSRSDYYSWVEALAIGAFCVSLFLIVWVGSGPLPFDLDSVLYMHSISFVLQNGWSSTLASSETLLIHSPYSLPMQSMLGAALVLVTNSSYITVAKYLPLLLMVVFSAIYYSLVSERFGNKVSLLSLAVVASFVLVIGYANTFNNIVLGTVFFLLVLALVFMRNSRNRLAFTILAFFVIGCFVFTHDLTVVFLIAALGVLALKDQILRIYHPELRLRNENVMSILLVAAVAVFAYYTFAFFGPIAAIVGAFTQQLNIEVASAKPPSNWVLPVLVERAFFVLFIVFSIALAFFRVKADSLRFLSRYANFFLLGVAFFVFSVAGALLKFPFNWDQISIYGWFFFVPVTLAMLFERGRLPIIARRGVLCSFSAVLVAALVFGNIYGGMATNLVDHTGANEYQGGAFKDWTKLSEWDAALWTIQYKQSGSQVVGDDLVMRLYLGNSPNFTGNFTSIESYNTTSGNSIIFIRNENSYQIVGNFYVAAGTQPQVVNASELTTNLLSNQSLYRVYDDGEVRMLYNPAP
jgi:hypothetical protein